MGGSVLVDLVEEVVMDLAEEVVAVVGVCSVVGDLEGRRTGEVEGTTKDVSTADVLGINFSFIPICSLGTP